MIERIGLWAFAGFGVAVCWVFFAAAFGQHFNFSHWIVFKLTFPLSWFCQMRMNYFEAIFLNAAAYALIGLATEPFWRRHH